MSTTRLAQAVALATLGASLTLPSLAHAEFIKDSKASLELRNFYMNRDFRERPASGQSKAEEWAQGFIFKAESGFTEGTVGFGLDAYAGLGLKLDSSDERAGTGLLPNSFNNEGPGEYSEATAALKVKMSKTVAKVGGLMPKLPIVSSGDSRLLPQVFNGGMINSQEIDGLSLNGGQLREVNFRNSTDSQDITATNFSGTNFPGVKSDRYNFAGGDYKFNSGNTTVGLWYGELEDIYDQKLYNLVHIQPIGDWKLGANLAYFDSQDNGKKLAGKLDNDLTSVNLWAGLGAHTFRLGYQEVGGDNAFPFLSETDPYIVNYLQILDFTRKDEKSWQARYDINFATYGVPGLTAFVRYVTGDGFEVANQNGKEWERDLDISYVVQEGPLKNLGVRWRNAMVRSDASTGELDENRLIVSYSIPLL